MVVYTELFKLESNTAQLTFVRKGHCTGIKINQVIYRTASANNYILLVGLSGWLSSATYSGTKYTKIIPLSQTTLTEIYYERPSDNNSYDVNDPNGSIEGNSIYVYINGSSTNTDISPSNPLYIEISYNLTSH